MPKLDDPQEIEAKPSAVCCDMGSASAPKIGGFVGRVLVRRHRRRRCEPAGRATCTVEGMAGASRARALIQASQGTPPRCPRGHVQCRARAPAVVAIYLLGVGCPVAR